MRIFYLFIIDQRDTRIVITIEVENPKEPLRQNIPQILYERPHNHDWLIRACLVYQ